MDYWIFKIAEQEFYPDEHWKTYVFDNTHSVRVKADDTFLYLDKTNGYSFTGTGTVVRISERVPSQKEKERTRHVRTVYTAHLKDVIPFTHPLSISPAKKEGRSNRALLGIIDANLLGWSQSIPALGESMYHAILELAEIKNLVPSTTGRDFSVPDSWSETKTRPALKGFSIPVLERSGSTCVVCGSALTGMVEAAHLSAYASDVKNRANPANGICLCRFCHRALDLRLIAIKPNGDLVLSPHISDEIALHHFSKVSNDQRQKWIIGVDPAFLELTVRLHEEYISNKRTE